MKKLLLAGLILAILIPGVAFAANWTNPAEIYQSVVGQAAERGSRLWDQAEAAGQGEAFFEAMQADQERYYTELKDEGVLTEEEADFLIKRLKQTSYADQQMMRQIRQKLQAAGEGGPGMGPGGMKGGPGGRHHPRGDCFPADDLTP